jgi:hypothetical protein
LAEPLRTAEQLGFFTGRHCHRILRDRSGLSVVSVR